MRFILRHCFALALLLSANSGWAQTATLEIEDEQEPEPESGLEITPSLSTPAEAPRELVAPLDPSPPADPPLPIEPTQPMAAPVDASPDRKASVQPIEGPTGLPLGLTLTGYIQAQYEWNALSEDQLQQGGVLLNRNRFGIRRGRIRLAGEWSFFTAEIELDGSNSRGSFFGLRRTTVGAIYRNEDRDAPPWIWLTVGLTEVPFGHEVRASQRDWLFMERSTGSLAFFRGPLDTGVRAQGGAGPFRYDFAAMSGSPLDDRAGQGLALDPTSAPDVIGRVGVELDPHPGFELAGGASFLLGTGFHPGQDATKGRLEWRDLNENGALDTGETVAVPGHAATPSVNFERWAFNVDIHGGIRTAIGWTRLYAEATLAQNSDRALFIADPIASGANVQEVAAYAAFVQDLSEWSFLGFRYDYYDPNSDLLENRRGLSVPVDASIHTFSPLIGARLPADVVPGFRGRLVFQYDAILDALGRDARGVPADLANDQFTLRVQGEFR